jgi:hypothetical protein
VFSSVGRESQQMGPEGWPCGFGGESGDVVVGLVELCYGLAVPLQTFWQAGCEGMIGV